MLLCSTTTSGFAVPFASNGRHKLIPLCGRCQDALSVIALSHLYPELGILARVLARKRKKKAYRKNRLLFFFFRVLGHAEGKKKNRIDLDSLVNSPSLPLLFAMPKGMTMCLIPCFMTLSLPSFPKREKGM